jgi:hypothetical protein
LVDVREILVSSEGDIIAARMETRLMAREVGMTTADQARVSLAASSLAHAMELGRGARGKIVLTRLNGNRPGVQIVCTAPHREDLPVNSLFSTGEWGMMVDELTVSILPNQDLLVVAIKWVA